MTTATTSTETKIAIAVEVLKIDETGKTKAQIAKEFDVSPRTVSRYSEKYEAEALDLISDNSEGDDLTKAFEETNEKIEELVAPTEETTEAEETETETTEAKPSFAEQAAKAKAKADEIIATKTVAKAAKPQTAGRGRGRKPDGVKSIKDIVIETMKEYKDKGEMTKENRPLIVELIMGKTDLTEKEAKKYFAGYKKQLGDYDIKS